MKTILSSLIFTAIVSLPSFKAEAHITVPHFMTDSMVVQQQSVITIKGQASGNVKIVTSWDKKTHKATAASDGSFSIPIPTPKAGGPFTITMNDSESSVTLRDIYSGEVWLCSGQSNMEMPVGGWGKVMNYQQEIANANHPEIRLLQIKKQIGYTPASDTEVNMGGWRTCSPATVENFSSIAYFYAREMARKLNVRVGVIDCSWGGTPAEAWTSLAGVSRIDGFEKEIALMKDGNFDVVKMNAGYEKLLNQWMQLTNSTDIEFNRAQYQQQWKTMPVPCEWEKTVLPEFDGIVWMQYRFNVPAECAGKPLTLNLGQIDDEDVTYFNGEKIATGSGYNVPRHYTVPANLVKAGEAVITVRVSDFGGGGGIWGYAPEMNAQSGDVKIPLAGDWAYNIAADFSLLPAKPCSVSSSSFPTTLYNAMLHPLSVMPVKGVLWYQGCANVGRDKQYSPLFKQLINDWRKLWNNEQLPFYFVQLAGYLRPQQVQPESQWAALRQAQADALSLDHTAMAVAIDLGNPNDIHPKNKQEVARRLSLIALHNDYGKKSLIAQAPTLVSWTTAGEGKALLTFSGKVVAEENSPTGFIVKLANGTWESAKAVQTGKTTIELSASGKIIAVKYNWADYPDGNLRGETGLPIAQFNTEK